MNRIILTDFLARLISPCKFCFNLQSRVTEWTRFPGNDSLFDRTVFTNTAVPRRRRIEQRCSSCDAVGETVMALKTSITPVGQ